MKRHSDIRATFRVLALTAMLLGALSCHRRPLEDPDFSTRIEVKVNITAIANVTCDVYNEYIPIPDINPEVMRVMFYSPNSDKLLAESFITDVQQDENGQMSIRGDISILPGDYRMLIYQFGTESTQIWDYASFDKAAAYTDALSEEALKALQLKADVNYDQPIRYQPDHTIVARSEHETIPYHAGVYTITAQASSIVETYYLQVKVDGLQWVSSARAVLTSMSPSVTLAAVDRDYDNPCAIYTPLLKSEDHDGEAVVCNIFNTFGRIPESTNNLDVTFELRTTDGRTISKTFDISDLFLSEDCINHHWLLVEETIVVPPPEDPDPSPGGGGFDPTVDDWEEERHEIEL